MIAHPDDRVTSGLSAKLRVLAPALESPFCCVSRLDVQCRGGNCAPRIHPVASDPPFLTAAQDGVAGRLSMRSVPDLNDGTDCPKFVLVGYSGPHRSKRRGRLRSHVEVLDFVAPDPQASHLACGDQL